MKESRRSALGLLWEIYGDQLFAESAGLSDSVLQSAATLEAFTSREAGVLRTALAKGINCPTTSSAGRLFDAVASLTGIRQVTTFEGQAAMELEFCGSGSKTKRVYPFRLTESPGEINPLLSLDWEETIAGILADLRRGVALAVIGRCFHNTLCAMMKDVARRSGMRKVVLSGGCFQNRLLTEEAIDLLSEDGFQVYWHQRIPPNDGGLAVGQLMAAAREIG